MSRSGEATITLPVGVWPRDEYEWDSMGVMACDSALAPLPPPPPLPFSDLGNLKVNFSTNRPHKKVCFMWPVAHKNTGWTVDLRNAASNLADLISSKCMPGNAAAQSVSTSFRLASAAAAAYNGNVGDMRGTGDVRRTVASLCVIADELNKIHTGAYCTYYLLEEIDGAAARANVPPQASGGRQGNLLFMHRDGDMLNINLVVGGKMAHLTGGILKHNMPRHMRDGPGVELDDLVCSQSKFDRHALLSSYLFRNIARVAPAHGVRCKWTHFVCMVINGLKHSKRRNKSNEAYVNYMFAFTWIMFRYCYVNRNSKITELCNNKGKSLSFLNGRDLPRVNQPLLTEFLAHEIYDHDEIATFRNVDRIVIPVVNVGRDRPNKAPLHSMAVGYAAVPPPSGQFLAKVEVLFVDWLGQTFPYF